MVNLVIKNSSEKKKKPDLLIFSFFFFLIKKKKTMRSAGWTKYGAELFQTCLTSKTANGSIILKKKKKGVFM